MKNLKISTLILASVVLFASCANKKKKEAELEIKKGEIEKVVTDYVYPLPSSFELMDMLNEIEAAFIIGISNAPENVGQYETRPKQALNLGVYLLDLSYASIYNRKQSAQDYLVASEALVRELHVDDAFEEGFVARVSENIDNRDELVDLLSSATQSVYGDFHRKGNKELAYLMVAGGWIEAMHLTLTISENTPLNQQIINTIIFQHQSLLETIALLEEVKEAPSVSPILTALMGIKNTFDQEDPSALTVDQVKTLTKQVIALRAHIVE